MKLVDHGGIEGAVLWGRNHGAEMIITVSVADLFIRATIPPSVPVTLNQGVQIAFAQDKLHFFDVLTTENLADPGVGRPPVHYDCLASCTIVLLVVLRPSSSFFRRERNPRRCFLHSSFHIRANRHDSQPRTKDEGDND